MRMKNVMLGTAALLAAIVPLGACQAERSVAAAESALEEARAAHADYLAPYEWRSAELYLDRARHDLLASEERGAMRYAAKAAVLAGEAKAKAAKKVSR
ncbi:MAG: DUF4398 domain-containing protein [Deltaproteobacteria bacterium]|nr:DUF4398 domain-containing protein [Deltaproteobacteria bacterium]